MTTRFSSPSRLAARATRISLFCSVLACDLNQRDVTTTGVNLEAAPEDGPRGFAVVSSDVNYEAYNVSLLDLEGNVLSGSLISSGSADVGLSSPLTDVVLPSVPMAGAELVVINRAPAAFLTWIDLTTAAVRAQLDVSTGFGANPYDYVPLSPSKAYVTRYESNLASGALPFDAGNDVLVIDPAEPAIVGRIDLMPALAGEPSAFLPRAARALLAGRFVRVLALGFDENHLTQADARIISIDPETDTIAHVLVLAGMQNCQTLALSPDGSELAVGCSGPFGADPSEGFPSAGIVLLDVADELREKRRLTTATLGGEAVNSVSYASSASLTFTTYGRYDASFTAQEAPDRALYIDLTTDTLAPRALRETSRAPFNLNDIRCEPSHAICLLTDAETDGGVVHRFAIEPGGRLAAIDGIAIERELGLSPRSLGSY